MQQPRAGAGAAAAAGVASQSSLPRLRARKCTTTCTQLEQELQPRLAKHNFVLASISSDSAHPGPRSIPREAAARLVKTPNLSESVLADITTQPMIQTQPARKVSDGAGAMRTPSTPSYYSRRAQVPSSIMDRSKGWLMSQWLADSSLGDELP